MDDLSTGLLKIHYSEVSILQIIKQPQKIDITLPTIMMIRQLQPTDGYEKIKLRGDRASWVFYGRDSKIKSVRFFRYSDHRQLVSNLNWLSFRRSRRVFKVRTTPATKYREDSNFGKPESLFI